MSLIKPCCPPYSSWLLRLSHKALLLCFFSDSRVRRMLCHWPTVLQSALWHGHGLIYKLLCQDYLSSWCASQSVNRKSRDTGYMGINGLPPWQSAFCVDMAEKKVVPAQNGLWVHFVNNKKRKNIKGCLVFCRFITATYIQTLHLIGKWTLPWTPTGLLWPEGQFIESFMKQQHNALSAHSQQHNK